jgi:NADH-quinone oxidoreductase subunit K
MLNAVNLSLISFATFSEDVFGQVLVFFVMAVAAAEAAIGLAIVIALYRLKKTLNIDNINLLKS